MSTHLPVKVLKRETDAVLRGVNESLDADPASLGRRLVSCNNTYKPSVSQTSKLRNGSVYFPGFFRLLHYCPRHVRQRPSQNNSRSLTPIKLRYLLSGRLLSMFQKCFCLHHQGDRPYDDSKHLFLLFFVVLGSDKVGKHSKYVSNKTDGPKCD